MTTAVLATEDELSEAVGIKLLAEHPPWGGAKPMLLRRNGFGYLRSRIDSWRQMAAHGQIVVVLTDLDRAACPLNLISDWLGAHQQRPQNLLLRVAVREVESWLLADHAAIEKLLCKKTRLPPDPDELTDPKQYLLKLAEKAPRFVREDLIAQNGAVTKQGLGYNRRLVEWVKAEWSPVRAAEHSPSLLRARRAIYEAAIRMDEGR